MLPEHLFPPYFQRDPGRVGPAEGQPPRQKITAEGHVGLTVALDLCIGTLQQDLRVVEPPLLQICFCPHDGLRSHAVPVGDLIIVGHTFIHLRQLPVQLTGLTVEHHQHRGRAEGPPTAVLDADGRVGHLRTGAAVQAAHGRDIVVHEKAQDQVALSQKAAFFFLRPLRMLCHRGQQKLLQLHHFRDLPPVEHTAHQYQNGKGVPLERFHRTAPQPFQQLCRVEGRQQDPGIPFDDLQRCIVVLARLVGGQGMEILLLCLIPRPVPFPAGILLFRSQPGKQPHGTLLEHVMEPEGLSVRQSGHKGVLLSQGQQDLLCVRHFGHDPCHFHRELIRKPHYGKELPLLGRQVFQHRRREHGVDIGILAQQDSPLG